MAKTYTYVVVDYREEITTDAMGTAHKKYVFVIQRQEDGITDEIYFIDKYPSDDELDDAITDLHNKLKLRKMGHKKVITE
jgi:hypothetical protein